MKQLYSVIGLGIYFLFISVNAQSQVNFRLVGGLGHAFIIDDEDIPSSLQVNLGVDAQIKFLNFEVLYNRSIAQLGDEIPVATFTFFQELLIDNISTEQSIFSNYHSVQFSAYLKPYPHRMNPYVGIGFARDMIGIRTETTIFSDLFQQEFTIPSQSLNGILFNVVIPLKNFSIKVYHQHYLDDLNRGFLFRRNNLNKTGFSINYHLDIINKTSFTPKNKRKKEPLLSVNLGLANNIPINANSVASFHPWIELDYYLNTKSGISASYLFEGQALGFRNSSSIAEQFEEDFGNPTILNKSSRISTAKINYFRNKILSNTTYLFYGPGVGYYQNRRIGRFNMEAIFEEQNAVGGVLAAGIKSKFLYASLEWHLPFTSYSSFITFKSGFRINIRKKVNTSEEEHNQIYRRR